VQLSFSSPLGDLEPFYSIERDFSINRFKTFISYLFLISWYGLLFLNTNSVKQQKFSTAPMTLMIMESV